MAKRKKKRLRLNPKFLIALLLIAVAAVVLFLTPLFDITDIKISGTERNAKAEVLIASGIRENKNIFAINKGAAEKNIKALGYVESVKIKRRLPNVVLIEVKESTVCAYMDYGGMYVGINKAGKSLCRVSKALPVEGAPIVKGISVIKADLGEKVRLKNGKEDEFEVLINLLDTFEKHNLMADITEIDVAKKSNIMFRYKGKLKIELGGLEDYDLKFNYIKAMLSELGEGATGVINMQSENYTYRNTVE